MSGASNAALIDAAGRLHLGVGVWIEGRPHLTVQVDWEHRPSTDEHWIAVEQLQKAHRQVAAGCGGHAAQLALRDAAASADPNADVRPCDETRQAYLNTLVRLAAGSFNTDTDPRL